MNTKLLQAASRSGYLVVERDGGEEERRWLKYCAGRGAPAVVLNAEVPELRIRLPEVTATLPIGGLRRRVLRVAQRYSSDPRLRVQISPDLLAISGISNKEIAHTAHIAVALLRWAGVRPEGDDA